LDAPVVECRHHLVRQIQVREGAPNIFLENVGEDENMEAIRIYSIFVAEKAGPMQQNLGLARAGRAYNHPGFAGVQFDGANLIRR
jgi:hypothetical protein